jgi:hypothetical protein
MTETAQIAGVPLSDDDRMRLARGRIGRRSFTDWLASDPPATKVRAMLVKVLDRGGPQTVFARVLGAHLGADPARVYAENWPPEGCAPRCRGSRPR